jgi:hypothetical protein
MKDSELLDSFVKCFRDDGCAFYDGDLIVHCSTDSSALEPIYSIVPIRFPALFERLILSYRWNGADVARFRLLANPPGSDLSGLLNNITGDKALYDICSRNGYVPFGKGPGVNYDPVCFDIKKNIQSRQYPIVRLDHEEILCNSKIKVVEELAPDFDELVLSIVSSRSDG